MTRYPLMKSLLLACLTLLTVLAIAKQDNDVPPPIAREARGVWVATVGNIDWPSRKGLSADQQKAEVEAILDRAAHLHLNFVVLQVRPAADAFYPSSVYPWSAYLTGTMGEDPGYNPLQFWIDEAHKRGIELHAWLNPYRAATVADTAVAAEHISAMRPDLVRRYADQLWLDPGEPDSQKLILDGIRELVTNYDLDGVHFDDYFYPYPVGNEPFPDDQSFARSGAYDKADWRRQNVDSLVQATSQLIHSIKPWVKFGISPFGIWKPGNPTGVSGLDPTTSLFADSREWLQNGWVDYLSPQLYWRISAPRQPFGKLLKWWTEQNTQGRHIWPGCYASQSSWPAWELTSQVKITRQVGGGGNLHFSARALMKNTKGIATLLRQKVYGDLALVPASPWLKAEAPQVPKLGLVSWDGNRPVHFEFKEDGEQPRFYVVATRYGTAWSLRVIGGDNEQWDMPGATGSGLLQKLYIAALDKVENMSAWTEVRMPPPPALGN